MKRFLSLSLLLALATALAPIHAQSDSGDSTVADSTVADSSASGDSAVGDSSAADSTDAVSTAADSSAADSTSADSSDGTSTSASSVISHPAPGETVRTNPAAAVNASVAAAPISIVFEAPLKVVEGAKVSTSTLRLNLNLSAERVAALRAKGGVSSSLTDDLNAFLDSIPRQPKDTRFEQFSTGWALVQHDGYTIDPGAVRQTVKSLLTDKASAQALIVHITALQTLTPARTLDYFVSKGITSHLGTGQTTYYGSSAARVANIHTGTKNFQDRLLADDTFSFNQAVGPVTARDGYLPGLVIAGDRTASGVGGGICQVSTTVFRTLYAAGLPILERHNHSYQVHYYDPQGMDATIYQPSLDLRFRNTTGGALWFQAEWDDKAHSLEIDVFGKPQAYTVSVAKPRVLSTRPSPPDRLIPSASLAAGRRSQIDYAAPGATIEVTRTLKNPDGSTLRQDTLKSVYRPWPNIFYVGTRR